MSRYLLYISGETTATDMPEARGRALFYRSVTCYLDFLTTTPKLMISVSLTTYIVVCLAMGSLLLQTLHKLQG